MTGALDMLGQQPVRTLQRHRQVVTERASSMACSRCVLGLRAVATCYEEHACNPPRISTSSERDTDKQPFVEW